MSEEIRNIFADQLHKLADQMSREWAWPSVEAGFAQYVFHSLVEQSPLPAASGIGWLPKELLTQAPPLASTGYLMRIRRIDPASVEAANWLEGAKRLQEKKAFPSDRQSFAYRPLEVFGIGLGLASCKDQALDLRQWFNEVVQRLIKETDEADVWSQAFLGLVAMEFGLQHGKQLVAAFDSTTLDDLSLIRWVFKTQPKLPFLESARPRIDSLDSVLMKRFATGPIANCDLARASLRFSSLRNAVNEHIESAVGATWQIGKQTSDAVKIVENLCRRFHLLVMQIAVRHGKRNTISITDEYDVQDIMHALLKLFFDDVRAEEVTPSYAGKSSRMDFVLKREQIVIETKMTRKGLDQNGVATELIDDKHRYRTHQDCKTLICLVYDPALICKNPTALENDVSADDGTLTCVVIVSPKGL